MSDSISRWWWYVVFYFVFAVILYTPLTAGDRNILAFVATFVFATAFPFLGLCLYMDARKVDKYDTVWNPTPYIYGGFGLVHGLSGGGYIWIEILFRFEFVSDVWTSIPSRFGRQAIAVMSAGVGVLYLIKRFRYVGFR